MLGQFKARFNFYQTCVKSRSRLFPHRLVFRPSLVITITVVLTLVLFVPQAWMTWQAYQNFNSIIKNELRLQTLSDKIIYFDEVLTMSARMNAATGNSIWEQRYRLFEPHLLLRFQLFNSNSSTRPRTVYTRVNKNMTLLTPLHPYPPTPVCIC
jgi:hypothetical protein